MKIAVVGTRGFPNVQGGVEAHCEHLYPLLAKIGCTVTVFARKPYLEEKEPYYYKGVKIVPLSCPKNKSLEALLHTFYAVFQARKLKPDLLHIHAVGPALCAPLARILGLKVVMTHHGPDYCRKKWGRFAKQVLKLGEFAGSKSAVSLIAVSDTIAAQIKEKYRRQAKVIPNGVEEAQLQQTDGLLQKLGIEKGKYILAVGRFVPEKGFLDLCAAFTQLELTGWKLVIVGKADHAGRYSEELEKWASWNKNIILPGFHSGKELWEIYTHAGIFVLPSYYEGLPIALLEALGFGISCIVSDIAANKEVGLSCERYFTPGDINGLKEKIKTFITRPQSDAQKQAQIRVIKEKYNWEKIAQSTWKVYCYA
ncbi:MAG: glycosyltransferase family 4 protein [Candidatus Omnitrophica bacterium]|nr:glycosyltransferase family 4 protein [Candidatus Omnitrophota bacterium]